MKTLTTSGRITILLGKLQVVTGERMSLRGLASKAEVPKDFVYRLDAGEARHVDLDALARLCHVLNCGLDDILVWSDNGNQQSI